MNTVLHTVLTDAEARESAFELQASLPKDEAYLPWSDEA